MADRTNPPELGGTILRLVEQPNETRAWDAETAFLLGDVEQEFLEVIPWGKLGMGSSIYGDVPGEYHYGFDTDPSQGDQLSPGLAYSTITLASGGSVTKLVPARDASGNRYVYVVNNSALLFKIRLDTMVSTGTKTFAQVGAAAVGASVLLTDLLVTKDGAAPGSISRTVTQPPIGFLIAMFGETSAIQYSDAIAVNAVDTWAGAANTAFGGVGCVMQGAANNDTVAFKSTASADLGTTGNFSRLQYKSVPTSAPTVDFSSSGVWSPGTPYQLPYIGESITKIISYGRGPLCAQPSGVTQFDANYNSAEIFTMRNSINDDNGKHMQAFGRALLIPTGFDLMDQAKGRVGLKSLKSNVSPVFGYPTAMAQYGDDLYVAFYTGVDTYICRLQPRNGENVPQDYLIFPMTKLASTTCRGMLATTRANGDTILLFGNGTNLSWMIIDPVASRTYATGGQHYLPIFGDGRRFFQLEEFAAFGSGLGGTAYWTVDISIDEAAFTTMATWNSSGRKVFQFTPGTNDTGTRLSIRLSCTNSTPANQPLLKGGGLTIKGKWRAGESVVRIVFRVEGGTWATTGVQQDRATLWSTLKALMSPAAPAAPTPTTLKWVDFFGDSSTHKVILEKLHWIEGQGSNGNAQSFLEATVRTLLGTT